uniref:S1 motif domain-containing protein n=1 Tax=Steinernema glaseri TaxID=37863 RepID=A0A1I7ZTV1_9BILA
MLLTTQILGSWWTQRCHSHMGTASCKFVDASENRVMLLFTVSRNDLPDHPSPSTEMVLDEVDFPRGGVLTEKKPTVVPKASDVTAADGASEKKKDKKKRVKSDFEKLYGIEDPDADSDLYKGVWDKPLKSEFLAVGVLGLGAVRDVFRHYLILETSCSCKVKIPAAQISKQLSENPVALQEIFAIGQMLAFKVTKSSEGKMYPEATLSPSALNSHLTPSFIVNGLVLNGVVSSIEDKGALIDLGLSEKTQGFLANADMSSDFPAAALKVGQPLLLRVHKHSGKTGRVIKVTAQTETDNLDENAVEKLTMNRLMPGTILYAVPEEIKQHRGAFVNLGNNVRGFIHLSQFPPRLRFDLAKFTTAIRCVVMACQQNAPLLVLSAHPDVIATSRAESRSTFEDIDVGDVIKCVVANVDKKGTVAFKLYSSADASKISPIVALAPKAKLVESPEGKNLYKVGSEHECRVYDYRMIDRVLLVSNTKEIMKRKILSVSSAEPGTRVKAVIKSIHANGLQVELDGGIVGFVPIFHTADRPVTQIAKAFEVGQEIDCRVLFTQDDRNNLFLTAKASLVKSKDAIISDYESVEEGTVATGVVAKIAPKGGVVVVFYDHVGGFIHKSVADRIMKLRVGMPIRVTVAKVDAEAERMLLMPLEEYLMAEPVKEEAAQKDDKKKLKSAQRKPPKPFDICTVKVLGPWHLGEDEPSAVFAALEMPDGSLGRLHASELDVTVYGSSKKPMVDFLEANEGKTVIVKVVVIGKVREAKSETMNEAGGVIATVHRIAECTMNPTKIAETQKRHRLIQFEPHFLNNSIISAYVDGLAQGNNCIRVSVHPTQRGVVHLGSKNDEDDTPLEINYENGEVLTVRVVGTNRSHKGKSVLALSLNLDQFSAKDEEIKLRKKRKQKKSTGLPSVVPEKILKTEDLVAESKPCLEDPGFDFNDTQFTPMSMANVSKIGEEDDIIIEGEVKQEVKEESESGDDSDVEMTEQDQEVATEKRLLRKESQLLQADHQPTSAEEFDRLVSGNPNSSELWIRYIMHFLEQKDVIRARGAAERALKLIHYREEAELFNVWTAYLNMEVMYGTPETVKKTFDRAIQNTDSLKMHKQMVKIYKSLNKIEEVDELFESMLKRFRHQDIDVWVLYGQHLMETERPDAARELMQRALKALSPKSHVTIMSRFAQMEYKLGDSERGKTQFEAILNTYPKRTDVWSVYIDMVVKHAKADAEPRKLFERVTSCKKLPSSKVRVFFQKWLQFEELKGDAETQEKVREQALEYAHTVRKNLGEADE